MSNHKPHLVTQDSFEAPLSTSGLQTEKLDEAIPTSIQFGTAPAIILTPTERTLIIMYCFIGLAELVSVSSNTPIETIWNACIERSIRNLKKDGLLR